MSLRICNERDVPDVVVGDPFIKATRDLVIIQRGDKVGANACLQ